MGSVLPQARQLSEAFTLGVNTAAGEQGARYWEPSPYAAYQRQSLPGTACRPVAYKRDMCASPPFPPVNQQQKLRRSAAYFERSIMDMVHEIECAESPVNSCAWQQSIGSFDRQSNRSVRPGVCRVATNGYAYVDQPVVPASGERQPYCMASSEVMSRQETSQDILDILTLMREG